MRGMARGLFAHRAARPVQLLRGLHSHRRFDVQPACEVAEGHRLASVAPQDRLAQLPAELPRLAPGSQWLHSSGSGLHRSRDQQEGGGRAGLPAARLELPAVRDGSLPAQPPLRQRGGGRQASRAAVAVDGCGAQALHRGRRHLAMGEQRPEGRARPRHGLRRRRTDARDAGGGVDPARASSRAQGPRRQRGRPHEASAGLRASARDERLRFRFAVHPGQAGHLRVSRAIPG